MQEVAGRHLCKTTCGVYPGGCIFLEYMSGLMKNYMYILLFLFLFHQSASYVPYGILLQAARFVAQEIRGSVSNLPFQMKNDSIRVRRSHDRPVGCSR